MKKLFFISCLCLSVTFCLNAQTNTFPTSGNVGIGTTSPTTLLSLQGDNKSLSVAFDALNYSTSQPIGAQFGAWSENSAAGIKFHRWLGTGTLFHTAYIGQSHYNYGDYGLDFRTDNLSTLSDATTSRMYISSYTGNIGIGTTNPLKKLSVNGDILLENASGIKQIFTWSPDDTNWRIGMNENPGFNRSILTTHVQFLTYSAGATQGFAVGVNGGDSSLEIRGSDHTAFFRGNVGIGTTTPDSKLTVAGKIHSQEVKVSINAGADFVFNDDYNLPTLNSIETFVKKNKHLPEIASEKDMKENGLYLAEMNIKLLQKIEELTLYTIQQEKDILDQKTINKSLETKLETQDIRLQKIEALLNSKKQ